MIPYTDHYRVVHISRSRGLAFDSTFERIESRVRNYKEGATMAKAVKAKKAAPKKAAVKKAPVKKAAAKKPAKKKK